MVLLCEDKQHRAFVTRLIHRLGWKPRDLRIEQSPTGRGSAEHYVRDRFPRELQWLRSKGGERVYLIVMVDGDAAGVSKRKASLSAACHQLALNIQVSHTPRHVMPVPPEYWEKPTVHPTGESLRRTGIGNADSCISWSGREDGLLHSSSKPPSMNNRG